MLRRRDLLVATAGSAFATLVRPNCLRACPSGRRAAIVIGLDYRNHNAGGMPSLRAAVAGAHQFAGFLRRQGFEVSEFLDDTRPVQAHDVYAKVQELIQGPSLDQLVVYFGGHGIIKNDSEVWLLSDAPYNPNAAFDLEGSIRLARRSQIPTVVFVSDTCRSPPRTLALSELSPSTLFPSRSGRTHVRSVIDRFFATAVGDPAYELLLDENARTYEALFTSVLLDACRHPPPSVIVTIGSCSVISNRELKGHLEETVPRIIQARWPDRDQQPEIICEGGREVHFARASDGIDRPGTSSTTLTRRAAVELKLRSIGLEAFGKDSAGYRIEKLEEALQEVGLSEAIRTFVDQSTAVDVPGFDGMMVFVNGTTVRALAANPVHKLRIKEGPRGILLLEKWTPPRVATSVLIEFSDGSGVVVPFVERFALHLFVSEGTVRHLLYEPTPASWWAEPWRASNLREVSATIAAARARGAFALEGPLEERRAKGRALVDVLRRGAPDPAFAVATGHALSSAGLFEELDWLEAEVWERLGYRLFDLLLLREKLPSRAREQSWSPCLPMMARTWALMAVFDIALPEALDPVRRYLRPAIWTHLEPGGVAIVRDALRKDLVR